MHLHGCELHAEDAELRARLRRVRCGIEPECDNAARVERIDDAVIPQSRGRIIGITFALVFLENRRSKAAFSWASSRL